VKLATVACTTTLGWIGCTSEPAAPLPHVQAAILRASDTVRFRAPAAAHHCRGAGGVLLEALGRGSGVLVWLRGAKDTIAGSFPVVGVRDTVTRRAAVVAVRYVAQAVPHTLALDSGTVVVADSGGVRRLQITGSGVDLGGGSRPAVRVTFEALPHPTDSASCTPAP